MTDIELIIKIPEEVYTTLKTKGINWHGNDIIYILNAVAKGTPLEEALEDIKAEIQNLIDDTEECGDYTDLGEAIEVIDRRINANVIEIGDEILNKWGTKGIVIEIAPQYNGSTIYSVFWRNSERKCWDKSDWEDAQVWKKTGRRFSQIISVLKQMTEGDEDKEC